MGTQTARHEKHVVAGQGACYTELVPRKLTAVVEKEGKLYVALCPELDVASQGKTVKESLKNLKEAVELYLECASPAELKRLPSSLLITTFGL